MSMELPSANLCLGDKACPSPISLAPKGPGLKLAE